MTNVYSTACTPWFIAAQQAVPAGGAPVNLLGGSLKVGDGNGAVPTISQIIANGGVLHQVWAGAPNSVTIDATNTGQIDVGCLIPTVDGTGAEIGPFNVTEFAIYDATGNLAIVGTTNLQKTTSAQGQLMTLQWFACYIAAAANAVTIQPPSGSFPTLGALQTAIAGLLSANLPITVTGTLQTNGWTSWLLNIASATMSALGIGRPATNAEFAAGESQTGFPYPWPTLQQIAGAIAALNTAIGVALATALAAIPGAASTAQTIAGVVANLWISPASLYGGLATATGGSALINALSAALGVIFPGGSGWRALPGGLIVQWGSGTLPASGSSTSSLAVVFPISFPNGVLYVGGTPKQGANAVYGYVPSFGAFSATSSGFNAIGDTLTGASATTVFFYQTCGFFWIAFGY